MAMGRRCEFDDSTMCLRRFAVSKPTGPRGQTGLNPGCLISVSFQTPKKNLGADVKRRRTETLNGCSCWRLHWRYIVVDARSKSATHNPQYTREKLMSQVSCLG